MYWLYFLFGHWVTSMENLIVSYNDLLVVVDDDVVAVDKDLENKLKEMPANAVLVLIFSCFAGATIG